MSEEQSWHFEGTLDADDQGNFQINLDNTTYCGDDVVDLTTFFRKMTKPGATIKKITMTVTTHTESHDLDNFYHGYGSDVQS